MGVVVEILFSRDLPKLHFPGAARGVLTPRRFALICLPLLHMHEKGINFRNFWQIKLDTNRVGDTFNFNNNKHYRLKLQSG